MSQKYVKVLWQSTCFQLHIIPYDWSWLQKPLTAEHYGKVGTVAPCLDGQRHTEHALFPCEALSVIVLLRRKRGLPFCLIYIQFCNWYEVRFTVGSTATWPRSFHWVMSSHCPFSLLLFIVPWTQQAKVARTITLVVPRQIDTLLPQPLKVWWRWMTNAGQMKTGKCGCLLCPVSYAINSIILDSKKKSTLEIYISISE